MTQEKSDQNTPPPLPKRPCRSDQSAPPPVPKRPCKTDQNTPPPVPERPSTSGENVCRNSKRNRNARSRAAIREWLRERDVRPMKKVEQTSRRARCLKKAVKPMIAVILLLMLSGVIVMSIKLKKIREGAGARKKGVINKGTNINIIITLSRKPVSTSTHMYYL